MTTAQSQQYLRDQKKLYDWIKQYQQNPTEEIKTKLVLHFEDLVHSLARKFSRGENLHEDLAQVGMVGLMAALNRYDFSQNKSFESFAVPTIIGEIKRYLRDKTWSVHVPRRIKELSPKIKKAMEELTITYQRSPTVAEIAEFTSATEEEILEVSEISRSYQALSMDYSVETDQEGSAVTLLDVVGQRDQGFDNIHHKLLFDKIFSALNENEQRAIELTYLQGLSQKEAGETMEISQMHVSRLQRRSIEKLRQVLNKSDAFDKI